MKKKKIIWLTISIVILIGIVYLISIFLFIFLRLHNRLIIGERWEIQFPNCNMVYYTKTDGGFDGKSQKYIIYEFDAEPVDFLKDFDKGKNKKLEDELLRKIKVYIEYDLIITDEYMIDFANPYYSKSYNLEIYKYLYLFYFPHNNQLVLFEHLI